MSFFDAFFGGLESGGEAAVCCPFDHFTSSGLPYKESNPSAHVNTQDGLFHCKACGYGATETMFIERALGCNVLTAKKLQRCFRTSENIHEWRETCTLPDSARSVAHELGISDTVLKELDVASISNDKLSFPVFLHDHLIDIRTYDRNNKPKCVSRAGCPVGLIIPYDIWRGTPARVTLLCAGEKDMAVARSHGFNAITITGGEQTNPKIISEFKDRIVAIVYDNDEAGISGAKKIAAQLHGVAKQIKVVTNFHEVCSEEGQDITDFFTTYGKTAEDLKKCISTTPDYAPTPEELESWYPEVNLLTASTAKYVNRLVRSNIQVVAVYESSYVMPTAIAAEKFKLAESANDTMTKGDMKTWEYNAESCESLLHLIDNNFKEATIADNVRGLLKIPLKEKGVAIKTFAKEAVYKAQVTDLFETADKELIAMEYTAYSIGFKLESGHKYLVTHKLVPHPYRGQQLVMVITKAVQADDSVNKFVLNDKTKEHLEVFRKLTGTTADRIDSCVERVKGLVGYNGNATLIKAMDLAYHTVLAFNFGNFKDVRGYLDTMIVAESRTGKSSTAEALRKTYGLGVFTSLAGNSATVPGLIGGSNKTSGGNYQTRAGLIPQNHKGLIIFEEFGKSSGNIITELTDIRSSNEVRITRVSGTITMPATVRMITLTNVKTSEGHIRPIATYPHGIDIATELIGTAEDIARYDMLVILADRGQSQIDPLWEPQKPFPTDAYQTRVRWVWSRSPEQVLFDKEVSRYLVDKANSLNKDFDTHIKIFGTEAWKKIARLAIAIAGYTVSTDDTYENIVVLKEHVDYASDFLVSLYDNPTFKLREYVQHERLYSTVDEEAYAALQRIYDKSPSLLLHLEQASTTSKNNLSAAAGLNTDELNKLLNQLTKCLFIRFNKYDIVPTERFRKCMAHVTRNTSALRIGETHDA